MIKTNQVRKFMKASGEPCQGELVTVIADVDGFGAEYVTFEWVLKGHPSLEFYIENFWLDGQKEKPQTPEKIEEGKQKGWAKLVRAIYALTGREDLTKDSDLLSYGLKGMVCDLLIESGTFSGGTKQYWITSRIPVGKKQTYLSALEPVKVEVQAIIDDDVPF